MGTVNCKMSEGEHCKGTFGCHSFGLNSDPASAISCASDKLPLDFRRLPLDFRHTTRRQPQLDVLPLNSHSSANLASAPLPRPGKYLLSIIYITYILPFIHCTCTIYPAVLIVGTCLYVYLE